MPNFQQIDSSISRYYPELKNPSVAPTARFRTPELEEDPEFFQENFGDILQQFKSPEKQKWFVSTQKSLMNYYQRAAEIGIKAKELPERTDTHQPWYWWLLDKLNRPQYAVNAVVNELLEGDWNPWTITKAAAAAISGNLTIQGNDLVVKVFGDNLRDMLGQRWGHLYEHGLGLAFEIVADPLNFVGIGVLTKAGKLAKGVKTVGGIARAGDRIMDGKRVAEVVRETVPYLRSVGPELGRKIERRRTLFGRFYNQFTETEMKTLEGLGAVRDAATNMVLPGPRLAALETKYGRAIEDAWKAGRLNDMILGDNLLEKIERGQWSFINMFGHSLLPQGVNEGLYKLGAGLFRGVGATGAKVPGVGRLSAAVVKVADAGHKMFSTSSKGVKGIANHITESIDDIFWEGSKFGKRLGMNYLSVATRMFRKTLKHASPEDQMAIVRALELPMVDSMREELLLNPEARSRFLDVLHDHGHEDIAATVLDRWWGRGVKAGDTDTIREGLKYIDSKLAPEVAAGSWQQTQAVEWREIWDQAFEPWTNKGGLLFAAKGTRPDVAKMVADTLEPLSPDCQKAYQDLKRVFDEVQQGERSFNVLQHTIDGYFPRQMDPLSLEYRHQMPMPIYGIEFSRGTPGFAPAEQRGHKLMFFDDFVREMEKTGEGGEVIARDVIKNPALALAVRAAGVHPQAMKTGYIFRTVQERWGTRATDLRKAIAKKLNVPDLAKISDETVDHAAKQLGMRTLDDYTEGVMTKIAGGEKIYLPDDVAFVLERKWRLQNSRMQMNALTQAMANVQSWWKGWTLGVRMSFHTRNFATMLINNWMAGMNDPLTLFEGHFLSGVFQKKMHRAFSEMGGEIDVRKLTEPFWDRKMVTAAGKVYSNRELADLMLQYGVHGSGLFGVEGAQGVTRSLLPGTVNPLSSRNYASRAGLAMGKMFENNGRGALFLHQILSEGVDPAVAAKTVAKWHFDYDDLTNIEKHLRETLVPFYAWSRKNIPLQAELVLRHPPKASWVDKLRSDWEQGIEPDYYAVTKWIKDSMPIKIKHDRETGEAGYILLKNWVPAADLNEMSEPLDLAVNMLGPVPKLFTELGMNYSGFFKGPVEKYPGQMRSLLGVELPAKLQYTLKTIGLVGYIDSLNPGNVFGRVHQQIYGYPIRLTEDEPREAAKWLRAATGMKVFYENPAEVLMRKEYDYANNLRRFVKYREELAGVEYAAGKPKKLRFKGEQARLMGYYVGQKNIAASGRGRRRKKNREAANLMKFYGGEPK